MSWFRLVYESAPKVNFLQGGACHTSDNFFMQNGNANLTTSKEANKTSLINSMMGWKKMHAPENTDGFKSAWIV